MSKVQCPRWNLNLEPWTLNIIEIVPACGQSHPAGGHPADVRHYPPGPWACPAPLGKKTAGPWDFRTNRNIPRTIRVHLRLVQGFFAPIRGRLRLARGFFGPIGGVPGRFGGVYGLPGVSTDQSGPSPDQLGPSLDGSRTSTACPWAARGGLGASTDGSGASPDEPGNGTTVGKRVTSNCDFRRSHHHGFSAS